jgi:hypothetical protein
MRREHTHTACDRPDVQIMYIADAGNLDDIMHKLRHIQIAW